MEQDEILDDRIIKRNRSSSMRCNGVYSTAKAKRIAEMIVEGKYLLQDICRKESISLSTYYRWQREFPEFSEIIEEAKENFQRFIGDIAVPLLAQQMSGYEVKKVKKEYAQINPSAQMEAKGVKAKKILVKETVTKEKVKPDTQAIIFALTSRDPKNWKNRSTSELTGVDDMPLIPDTTMSREACEELLERLKGGKDVKP